jgi:hypothetical protein
MATIFYSCRFGAIPLFWFSRAPEEGHVNARPGEAATTMRGMARICSNPGCQRTGFRAAGKIDLSYRDSGFSFHDSRVYLPATLKRR